MTQKTEDRERRVMIIVIVIAKSWRLFARAFLNFARKRTLSTDITVKCKKMSKRENETGAKNIHCLISSP